ncbi:MAG: hypothetical protein QM760_16780 [Nibricoccus sp.]
MELFSPAIARDAREGVAARMFAVAWGFFAIASLIGLLLRVQAMVAFGGINYGHLLHAHSHVAFLGWVFNAFFALSMCLFVREREVRGYGRLFGVTQLAVVGMLIAYPVQGYARWSIAASTLHMVCSGVFAWKLWRSRAATGVEGNYLRAGLVCMVVSGAGPLALGPLAASGLRDSPLYVLAIYFYLHCQYNGWFLLFLQAALLRRMKQCGAGADEPLARRAFGWLGAGVILTFALSALWTEPPAWVRAAALAGGVAQLVGAFYFLKSVRSASAVPAMNGGVVRWLGAIAAGAYGFKVVLQLAAAIPGVDAVAIQRSSVIGFLHLVFLGVVTPLLIAAAIERGWMRREGCGRAGLVLYLAGALMTGVILAWPTFARVCGFSAVDGQPLGLVLAAALSAAGILVLAGALRTKQVANESGEKDTGKEP